MKGVSFFLSSFAQKEDEILLSFNYRKKYGNPRFLLEKREFIILLFRRRVLHFQSWIFLRFSAAEPKDAAFRLKDWYTLFYELV